MKRPLLRFIGLGTLLFMADGWLNPGGGEVPDLPPLTAPATDDQVWLHEAFARRYHESDAIVRRRLAQNMRFASPGDESSDAELVDQALALGMHESDLIVRRRLIQKMKLLVHERVRQTPPTEAELLAYIEERSERFTEPARVRLSQIFFRTEADARAAYDAGLGAPDTADAVGDALPIPRHLPPHSESELERQLGPVFAGPAFAAPLGAWSEPIESAYGHHLVWVHERREAVRSALDTVRTEATEGLLYERGQAAEAVEMDRLRDKYGVPREPAS